MFTKHPNLKNAVLRSPNSACKLTICTTTFLPSAHKSISFQLQSNYNLLIRAIYNKRSVMNVSTPFTPHFIQLTPLAHSHTPTHLPSPRNPSRRSTCTVTLTQIHTQSHRGTRALSNPKIKLPANNSTNYRNPTRGQTRKSLGFSLERSEEHRVGVREVSGVRGHYFVCIPFISEFCPPKSTWQNTWRGGTGSCGLASFR